MSVGYIFSLLNTTVYKKILVLFYIIMLILSITPANGATGDILINNENKLLESGKSWTLYEGYELNVTALDYERVIISLSKDGKEVHRKGEYRNYSYEYRNPTNISQLILRFRVIYINLTKIQLGNIFQISDGSLLSPIPTPTPTSNATTNIPKPGVSASEISRKGLVAEWHFDGNAKDSSRNGNDGIIYGATFVDGISGKALSFDGVSDYLNIPDSASLDITNMITIDVWVKGSPAQPSGKWGRIVDHGHYVNKEGYDLVRSPDSNTFFFDFWATDGIQYNLESATKINDNKWHHIISSYDGNTMKIYVDNVLENQRTIGQKTIKTTSNILGIGGNFDGNIWHYFNGIIDEVRIYNRALSADEIKVQYTSTIGTSGEIIGPDSFLDDFNGSALSSGWIVINKNSDSNISLTGTGILRMNASPMNGGSDYFNRSNYNALRILMPFAEFNLSGSEDGIVETKMNFSPTNNYQGAGIIMCYTPDSTTCDRAAERAFYPNEGGSVVRSAGTYVSYSNSTTYFRIMKKGTNYAGWYSSDGVNWILNGQGSLNDFNRNKYIGLFVVRQPWDGDTNVYSNAEFDYFKLTSLPSADASTPISKKKSIQDSLLEIIDSFYIIILLIITFVVYILILGLIKKAFDSFGPIFFKKLKRIAFLTGSAIAYLGIFVFKELKRAAFLIVSAIMYLCAIFLRIIKKVVQKLLPPIYSIIYDLGNNKLVSKSIESRNTISEILIASIISFYLIANLKIIDIDIKIIDVLTISLLIKAIAYFAPSIFKEARRRNKINENKQVISQNTKIIELENNESNKNIKEKLFDSKELGNTITIDYFTPIILKESKRTKLKKRIGNIFHKLTDLLVKSKDKIQIFLLPLFSNRRTKDKKIIQKIDILIGELKNNDLNREILNEKLNEILNEILNELEK